MLDTYSSTRIAGSHHASVVHNHSFAVDDEVMRKAVYVELLVHLVCFVVVQPIIGQDVLDAEYIHLVLVENFLKPFPVLTSTDGDEHDVFCIVFLPEFFQRFHLGQTRRTPWCPEVQINHFPTVLFQPTAVKPMLRGFRIAGKPQL